MYYKKLVDLTRLHQSGKVEPTIVEILPTDDENNNDIVKSLVVENNDKLDTIINLINKLNTESDVHIDAHTTLNDADVRFIISHMLEIHEKYFPDFPLSQNVDPIFIWNIQKPIIELSKKLFDYGYSDMINPLFWLYPMCIDVDEYTFIKIIRTLVDILEERAYKEMSEIIDAYEEADGGNQE